ncbi:hypothetical protein [Rhodococcus marinonascens]|uniref:hypothetical protein n=1 Tax=Rhodococcus marinonascens TaxID=38311 RepID=UPI001114BC8C|nr:hypothetical protein [Rhodococcus marinonascens]
MHARALQTAFVAAILTTTALTGGMANAASPTEGSVPDFSGRIPQTGDGPLLLAIAPDASQVSRVTELVDAAPNPATIDGFVTSDTTYFFAGPDDTSRPCSWHLYTVTSSGEFIEHNSDTTTSSTVVHTGRAFDDPFHNDLLRVDNCLFGVRL